MILSWSCSPFAESFRTQRKQSQCSCRFPFLIHSFKTNTLCVKRRSARVLCIPGRAVSKVPASIWTLLRVYEAKIIKSFAPRLERLWELDHSFLVRSFQFFKLLDDLSGFAAMPCDGFEKREGGTVMHQSRKQTNSPQRSGTYLIPAALEVLFRKISGHLNSGRFRHYLPRVP